MPVDTNIAAHDGDNDNQPLRFGLGLQANAVTAYSIVVSSANNIPFTGKFALNL